MPTFFRAPTTNFWSTTLNGAINDSVTTITLNSVTGLQAPGVLIIDREDGNGTATPSARELISFTGISGNDLTGCSRNFDGSVAKSHSNGALVEAVPAVGLWNDLRDAIAASLTTDGTGIALSGTASIATLNLGNPLSIPRIAVTSIASIAKIHVPTVITSDVTISNSLNASGASVVGLFPSGASGSILQSMGNAAVPAFIAKFGITSKVITSTRDATAASGNVAYTGVGFVPSVIVAFANVDGTNAAGSWGFSDSATTAKALVRINDGTNFSQTALIYCDTAAGANQVATIVSYDSDGFTLSWAKTGSPTGTIKLSFLCIK